MNFNLFNSVIQKTLITIFRTFVYIGFSVFDYENVFASFLQEFASSLICRLHPYASCCCLGDCILQELILISQLTPHVNGHVAKIAYGKTLSRRKFYAASLSTYHCVNQLHIYLHFLFSIIICYPWKIHQTVGWLFKDFWCTFDFSVHQQCIKKSIKKPSKSPSNF